MSLITALRDRAQAVRAKATGRPEELLAEAEAQARALEAQAVSLENKVMTHGGVFEHVASWSIAQMHEVWDELREHLGQGHRPVEPVYPAHCGLALRLEALSLILETLKRKTPVNQTETLAALNAATALIDTIAGEVGSLETDLQTAKAAITAQENTPEVDAAVQALSDRLSNLQSVIAAAAASANAASGNAGASSAG